LFVAVVLHGLYDFPLMVIAGTGRQAFKEDMPAAQDLATIGVLLVLFAAVLAFGMGWTVVIVRRLRRDQVDGIWRPITCGRRP
jgi:hypothetical protein